MLCKSINLILLKIESEDGSPKTEVRSRKSEAGSRKSEVGNLTPYFFKVPIFVFVKYQNERT